MSFKECFDQSDKVSYKTSYLEQRFGCPKHFALAKYKLHYIHWSGVGRKFTTSCKLQKTIFLVLQVNVESFLRILSVKWHSREYAIMAY